MSQLTDRLTNDFKEAMRNKDLMRKDMIQLVRAGILQIKKDQGIEPDDATVMQVVQREVKKRKELLPEFADREDLVEKAEAEITILESYLPEQLSEEELKALVEECIAETGASSMKDMGKVMPLVIEKSQGQADGKSISQMVKALLL